LKTPVHAQTLVDYFSSNPKVHSHGLDDTGIPATSTSNTDLKVITMEIASGKREEVYWEKVPEKVRRQAVMAQVNHSDAELSEGDAVRARKRRRSSACKTRRGQM